MVLYKAQRAVNDPSLPACLYCISTIQIPPEELYYTVVLFQKGLVALTVDSEQSYIDTVALVTLPDISGSSLARKHCGCRAFLCV